MTEENQQHMQPVEPTDEKPLPIFDSVTWDYDGRTVKLEKGAWGMLPTYPTESFQSRLTRQDEKFSKEENVKASNETDITNYVTGYNSYLAHTPLAYKSKSSLYQSTCENNAIVSEVEIDGRLRKGGSRPVTRGVSGKLTGDDAADYVRSSLGVGTGNSQPMIHSNFWIEVKNLTDSELCFIEDTLTQYRSNQLGRNSMGLALTHDRSMTEIALANFIIGNIKSCNIKDYSPQVIKDNLDIMDLQFLIGAQAAALFPDGYAFPSVCTVGDDCHATNDYILHPKKCFHYVRDRITESAGKCLSGAKAVVTEEDLVKYRANLPVALKEDGTRGDIYTYTRGDTNFTFHFKSVTLSEFDEYRVEWLELIQNMVNSRSMSGLDENQRRSHVNQTIALSHLTKFTHFVSKIEIINKDDDGEDVVKTVDDRSSILKVMDVVSSFKADWEEADKRDEHFIAKFENAVREFIDLRTLSIYGTKKFACKSCGKTPETKNNSQVIPRDPVSIFFHLAEHRLIS